MADYGYEDAVPDAAANPYGYESASPDGNGEDGDDPYGYGDGAPDSAAVATKTKAAAEAAASKYGYGYEDAAPDSDPYGYGDAAPDTDNKYGYGDATPDSDPDPYGYGDAAPDTDNKYGYGDASPKDRDYGNTYHTGYNDEADDTNVHASTRGAMQPDHPPRRGKHGGGGSSGAGRRLPGRSRSEDHLNVETSSQHSVATVESYGDYGYGSSEEYNGNNGDGGAGGGGDDVEGQRPRRQRYRRRGSVTKYSLEAQDTVQQEFDAHAQAIHHLREGGDPYLQTIPQSPKLVPAGQDSSDHDGEDDDAYDPSSSPSRPPSSSSRKDKKHGKKNRFRRFTMGF